MGKKKINKRAKGDRLERAVKQEIDAILKKISNIKFYPGIKAASSRGYADVTYIVYNKNKGIHIPFGIQCKSGYVSPAAQKEGVNLCMKKYHLKLFYCVGTPTHKEYYPDIYKFIQQELVQ